MPFYLKVESGGCLGSGGKMLEGQTVAPDEMSPTVLCSPMSKSIAFIPYHVPTCAL